MKIRQGFISNSSSSNFVIAFDKKPKSAKELRKLMFGDEEIFNPADYSPTPTKQIAEAVFAQLEEQLSLDQILGELTSGWLDGVHIDDWDSPNRPEMYVKDKNGKEVYNHREYEEYEDAKAEKETVRALKYFNNWKCPNDQVFFLVCFGDDDCQFGGLCEHAGIFENIHHVQISHH